MPTQQQKLNDGLFTGTILKTPQTCDNCDTKTTCLRFNNIELPKGIDPSPRLIPFKATHTPEDGNGLIPLWYIGIGCGCYAKAHRQIAHIQQVQKERGTVK